MDFGQQRGPMYQRSPTNAHHKTLGKVSHPSDKEFHLEMMTQPLQSIATEWTDDKKPRSHKKRKSTDWPLEPAPVVAIKTANGSEPEHHNVLTACPNVFCVATLTDGNGHPVSSETMRGRHSSSLIKLDKEAPAVGVFLFDQIHIRYPGQYCLLFTLFEMQIHDQGMHAVVHNVVRSNIFTVLPQPKRLPKPEPPAEILLALAAQGAKIKIRKPNEDRVKRKQDWSIDANDQDLSSHAQMMAPFHNQLVPISASLPQPNFGQIPIAMANPQYPVGMPPQAHYPLMMQTSVPQDINFGAFQDPNQQYYFHAGNSQQGFGNNFGQY